MSKKMTFKIWLLIIVVLLSLLSIFGSSLTTSKEGVLITSMEQNSTLYDQGLKQGDIITEIQGQKVSSVEDFTNIVKTLFVGNESVRVDIKTKDNEYVFYGNSLPEMTVAKIPRTNIKLGLDLSGGARALIKAQNKTLTQDEVKDLVDITSNRLNAFGLTDLKVMPVSDLSGNHFMLIEIAGATPRDLKKMISEQGKFEAKIGNETVFVGGNKDIASVGRDAQNARIETCGPASGGYACRFSFTVTLSGEAAKRHADITRNLSVNVTPEGNYLSKKLDLYLDGRHVDSLLIGEGLKGQATTQISISGSGTGTTQEEALENAKANMKQLQTILMTGSLPYKLEIVKLDTISPSLGENFLKSIFIAGFGALIAVFLVVWVRYRNLKASIALIGTTLSEIVIILGIAALIRWNLDLPSIAGILATMGTGLDDLIVLMDESSQHTHLTIKQRLKRAFAIIMGAYFTSLVSLLPLLWAGAGLLKGFAVTTIIGISVGVFITRPAFGDILKNFRKD